MPKRKLAKKEEEDEPAGSSPESAEENPKPKKKNAKVEHSDSEADEAPLVIRKPQKYAKRGDAGPKTEESGAQTNAEGEKFVDLGKKKRATVRSFKGNVFVDIREFYETNGETKPGKKGISLSQDQWKVLKKHMLTIDALFAVHEK
ncbi:transcriptional Coactivator p15-domain-containing protein [Infundibulicybe gibba]|nr:transcriptional Coactivator p15-domain-containing protein [Infundibulicybe gibba]